MRLLCVSKDEGNARAGWAVAMAARARGWQVTYVLDKEGRAWAAQQEGSLSPLFEGLDVRGLSGSMADLEKIVAVYREADAVLVTLSASRHPNLEIRAVEESTRLFQGKPTYGYEEVPGGRHNPGWEEGRAGSDSISAVQRLRRLFTVAPQPGDDRYPNVTVVGFSGLEWYRGKDLAAVGREARSSLGIEPTTPLVFYTGHPEPENPYAVLDVGRAILEAGIPDAVFVVARHGRERTTPVPDNSAAHRQALSLLAARGLRVIENSLGHKDLPADHPDAIPAEFRPLAFVSYQELVCTCAEHGVVVTGFGTDGALVAPFLHVPSILYLDPFLFGDLLRREKKLAMWPLPAIRQASSVRALRKDLQDVFAPESRAHDREQLRSFYVLPEVPAAERILDAIAADLAPVRSSA